MIASKNILSSLLGTVVLVTSTPALCGWTAALEDEKETRSTLLQKCQAGLIKTGKKSTPEETEKWDLWGKRFKALMDAKVKSAALSKEERENLKLLKKEKISLTSTSDTKEIDPDSNTTTVTLTTPLPSTTSEPPEEELRQQLDKLQLLKQLEQAKRELAEEKCQEVEKRLPPIPEGEEKSSDSSEGSLFGRQPERVEHNIDTELQRGAESFGNFLKGNGWKYDKKLKKNKKKHKF